MRLIQCCSALLLFIFIPGACRGGNILVLPADGSHWLNMDILIQALHSRGHNITVLRPSKNWYIRENSYYDTLTFRVERGLDQVFLTKLGKEIIAYERDAHPLKSFYHPMFAMLGQFVEAHKIVGDFLPAIINDEEIMRKIENGKFDLLLTDPCWGSGAMLAKYLNLPLVFNARWTIAEESHLLVAPSPLSYIPITVTGNTDKMTFFQRVYNMIFYLMSYTQRSLLIRSVYQDICDKHLGPDNDYLQLVLAADLWLMRVDFVFEYPRPTMPNVVYMGGFHCKPAKPLPEHLEAFVQSSGEHGVIIMSLGSFMNELPADMADSIAKMFAQLPQKVIWRHKGQRPAALGNNTLLVDWMPQNDLLGHPKTKLFVAHGGTNGVQEAIYHGVPVVGLPLFFDQYDNLLRLKEKGGAIILTVGTVDKDNNFLNAIQDVLNEPSYRMNMQRLSRLHRDVPVKPLDNALFWIEFVMRHKGAAHLTTESYKMPWYSYYSVDVFLFLAGVVMAVLFTFFAMFKWLFNKMCKNKVKHD